MPRYFPHRHGRPSKLLELKNPRPNRPSRAYKRPYAALRGTPHLHDHFFLSPESSIATTSTAPATTASSPPPAVDPPLQSTPAQGKKGRRTPSSPSPFPLSPATASPGGAAGRCRPGLLSPSPVWIGRERGRRKGIFAHTPALSHYPQPNPPLFPLFFFSNQTLYLKTIHQNNPAPLQLYP
jgi:hypothetical protein